MSVMCYVLFKYPKIAFGAIAKTVVIFYQCIEKMDIENNASILFLLYLYVLELQARIDMLFPWIDQKR